MSVLVPNNPRVRRAPRLAFLPSPRRSLRAMMAHRGQITSTTPGPSGFGGRIPPKAATAKRTATLESRLMIPWDTT